MKTYLHLDCVINFFHKFIYLKFIHFKNRTNFEAKKIKKLLTLFPLTSYDSEQNPCLKKGNMAGVPNWHPLEGNRAKASHQNSKSENFPDFFLTPPPLSFLTFCLVVNISSRPKFPLGIFGPELIFT